MDQAYQKNDNGYMLTYQLNQNDINIFFKIFNKKFILYLWFIFTMSLFVASNGLFPHSSINVIVLFVCLIGGGPYFFSKFFITRCTTKSSNYSFLIQNRSLLEVNKDNLVIEYSQKIKSIYQWKTIVKLIEKKDFLYIYTEAKTYLIVPCHIFKGELDKVDFTHFVKMQILFAKEQSNQTKQ